VRLGKYIATSKRPRPVLIRFDTIADKHTPTKRQRIYPVNSRSQWTMTSPPNNGLLGVHNCLKYLP
jgi:hypothetical protein